MAKQKTIDMAVERKLETVERYEFEPIKGYPMLHWKGKRPFRGTQYFPAQLKENHGEPANGWMNRIYWGDNLQVMSHLLKDFRGKVDLIYIDPPFDSKADYRLTIGLKGKEAGNDYTSFEEKQYTDLWINDEYLQFMYERIVLLRELLSETGSLFLHCDWHKSHYLRILLDEVLGPANFRNEIAWKRKGGSSNPSNQFDVCTDSILWYSKTEQAFFQPQYSRTTEEAKAYIEERFTNDDNGRKYMKSPIVSPNYRENLVYEYKGYSPPRNGWSISKDLMEKWDRQGRLYFPENGDRIYRKIFLDEYPGQPIMNLWSDVYVINPMAKERVGYPTQKPESLITRIMTAASKPGDLVLDTFMGSGTTQAVAMKMGRRFIGADINLGAIQTSTNRLRAISTEIIEEPPKLEFETEGDKKKVVSFYTGFSVYNVNQYDLFRNELEAKDLLLQALEIQPLPGNSIYDGEKDGRMVKVMPVNRIATKDDLNALITNFDYKEFARREAKSPNKAVEHLLIVCMGHEPDLKATLQAGVPHKLDIEIVDILRDKQDLQFKREAEAKVVKKKGELVIEQFYPMNLLQKLSMQKETVEDWRELVESVMVDWNYDGGVFEPKLVDVPDKNELVKGRYTIPKDAGTIKVKITDLLSESLEVELR